MKCPQCDEIFDMAVSNSKPFCSERCKLIDLGEWASEGHKIAGESIEVEIDIDQHNPSDYH